MVSYNSLDKRSNFGFNDGKYYHLAGGGRRLYVVQASNLLALVSLRRRKEVSRLVFGQQPDRTGMQAT